MPSAEFPVSLDHFASDSFSRANGAAKRRKTAKEEDYSAFAEGSIIRIKVKNFVTYATTEFVLSSSLNMIIGPNGTGKSTFVCALCLGLAGSPQLLGRQKTIANFIKNGEESGLIEVSLKNHGDQPNITISREIYLNNKSDWHINNKPSNESRVKALLSTFNIQLDNLCQFLPQEKVADFAKLSPKELLLETERAIDVKLLEQHEELIAKDNQKSELMKQNEAKKLHKESLERQKDEYEAEAKKYEEFQRRKDEMELHEKLVLYARVQDMKNEMEKLKKERDEIKKRLENYKERIRPFLNAANAYDDEIQDFANLIHDDNTNLDQLSKKLQKYADKIKELDNQREQLKAKNGEFQVRKETKLKELQKYRNHLDEIKTRRENLQEVDQDQLASARAAADKIHNHQNDVSSQLINKKGDLDEAKSGMQRIHQRIEKLRNDLQTNDRLHVLAKERRYQPTKAGVQALRSDLKSLRHEVFEPPCLTVTSQNKECALYLDALLDFHTSLAFTCSSKEAYEAISAEFFERRRINVSFRKLSGRKLNPRLPTEALKKLGFEGYLKDFLTGPAPVIQMLSEESFIHDIPIARHPLSKEQVNYLTTYRSNDGQPMFRKFFAGDTFYNLQISRYGSKQIIIKTSSIKSSSALFSMGGLTEERKQQLTRQIEDSQTEYAVLQDTLEPLRLGVAELNRTLASIAADLDQQNGFVRKANNIKKEREKLEQKISSLEEKCKTLEEASQKDYTREIIKNERRIQVVLLDKLKLLTEMASIQNDYNQLAQTVTILNVKKFESENKRITIKKLTKTFQDTKSKLEQEYHDAKRRLNEFKNNDLKAQLKEETAKFTQETRDQLSELIVKYQEENKFTETSVLDMIDSLRAKLKLLGNSSSSSIQEFEKLKRDLKSLEIEIDEYDELLNVLNVSMNKIHQEWEPKLSELVSRISQKFSSIFPTVGIAGDVRIARNERYQDWRLEILVKFREESDFKVLDSHTQSGGERAVSTIYYMISMQELTTSPFRVVDEINQGMDERNERIVHKHMVETACLEHTSQYFLITPKLLTGLYYSQNMRIHCIMAGPWTPNPAQNSDYLALGATCAYS